jgi:SHS family lactate transporter-like MFS transporter
MTLLKILTAVPSDFLSVLHMKPLQAFVWLACWACWTCGSMQYYVLPFTLSNVATTLHVPQAKISEANTTAMLSRSIGAVIFGVMADQYGRMVPLIIDMVLLGVFTLCTGFVQTYGQLVGCRFLFGNSTFLVS